MAPRIPRQARPIFMVIPCGAAKASTPSAARHLYTGAMFAHTLAAAEAEAEGTNATILVLSAKYGLITLDIVIAPYDVKMGDAGSVTPETVAAQAIALGIEWDRRPDVYSLLPKAYFRVLDAALRSDDVYAADVYEATAGIGEQRGVNRCVRDFPGVAA